MMSPFFMPGHEVVEQMQVRAADSATRHPDDGIAIFLDPWIGNLIAPDVGRAMPDQSSHFNSRTEKLPVRALLTKAHDAVARATGRPKVGS
jgi:hypothetical protein